MTVTGPRGTENETVTLGRPSILEDNGKNRFNKKLLTTFERLSGQRQN